MKPEEPPPRHRIPELNRFERKLLAAVIFGALGVGGLGLFSSYHAVSNAAQRWGFDPSWILPVGLDISIPVFSLANLLLIRFDMALAWVRFVPWALTLATVYLNVVAAGHSTAAQLGHGTLPLLWVVCSEIAAHVYRVLIGAATGRRMERVRRSRWLLAPFSTFLLWRRMVLWEVVSYRTGLTLERERRMIRAHYRQEHGRGWRKKVTRQQLAALKLGELAPASIPPQAPVPPASPAIPPAAELEPAPEPGIEVEPQREEVEPPADPEVEQSGTDPVPPPPRGTESGGTGPDPVERNRGTEDLKDRATTKEQQVKQVMRLLERYGTDKVTPKFVFDQTQIPTTTAFRRIKEAKARLEQSDSSGTEQPKRMERAGA